ncbi:Fic family protein [Niveispirillum sp. KHB5.9]|uniref:Fic family protein n=1 Tax=Niveispirillum sp. KHB5.9 TaxID=3400269 RepID=UPI003A88370E
MCAEAALPPCFDRQRHLEPLALITVHGWDHPRLQAELARAVRMARPWFAAGLPPPASACWEDLQLPIDKVAQIPASRIQRAPISAEIAARIGQADRPEVTAAVRVLALRLRIGQAVPGDLLALHAALLPDAPAGLRRGSIALRRADDSIDFQAPSADFLDEGLAFILAEANRAVAGGDLATLAGCYAAINFLHPFADGNGRTSRRLLLAGMGACLDTDLSPLPIDLVVWCNRTYHDYRLRQITQANHWGAWIAFVAQMLCHAVSRLPAPAIPVPLAQGSA